MFLSRSVISSTLVAILGVALVAAKPPSSWSPRQSAVSPINPPLVAIPIPSGVPNTFSRRLRAAIANPLQQALQCLQRQMALPQYRV